MAFLGRTRVKPSHLGRAVLYCLIGFSIQGCSLDANIASLSETVSEIFYAKTRDVTPASQQHIITASGYRVQGSVDFYKGKAHVVTSGGYKVQTNLQSTLFEEVR